MFATVHGGTKCCYFWNSIVDCLVQPSQEPSGFTPERCAADVMDMAALGPAARASLGSDLPLGSTTRQHSWTAGKAAPKYRLPAGPQGSLLATRLGQLPRTSPALASLSPLQEDAVTAPDASLPDGIAQQSAQLPDGSLPNGQLQRSFPAGGQLQDGFLADRLQHQLPTAHSHGTHAQSIEMQQLKTAAQQFPGLGAATAQTGPHLTSYPPLSTPLNTAQLPTPIPSTALQDRPQPQTHVHESQKHVAFGNRADDSASAHVGTTVTAPPARPLSPFSADSKQACAGNHSLQPVRAKPCLAGGSPLDGPNSAGAHFVHNLQLSPVDTPEHPTGR